MVKYKSTYCEFFGYSQYDSIPSEVSNGIADDIHHLTKRGKYKDAIWNLMALTREEHDRAEKDPVYNEKLKKIHVKRVIERMENCLNFRIFRPE